MMIKFTKKLRLLTGAIGISALLLSACGTAQKEAGQDTATATATASAQMTAAPSTAVQPAADSSASGTATRTIKDASGNDVVIPEKVSRVAAAGALNQITLMLGGGDKLVATAQGVQTGFFPKVYPRIKEIPAAFTGAGPGTLNMETLLQTDPEVLFGTAANDKETEILKSANIATVGLKLVTVEDIKNTISMVGEILGPDAAKKAEEFNIYYDGVIKYVKDKTGTADRPKVFVAGGDGSNGTISTIPAGDINTSYIEAAGGKNVAADTFANGSPTVNMEQILGWDPDVVIATSKAVYDNIVAPGSEWQALRAVKNKSVFLNPKGVYLWSVRSAEGALQPLWLAKTLHPDLFEDLDLKQKVTEFYKNYYYYDLTDSEIEEILHPTK